MSIVKKPYTALVGVPRADFNGGSAKKARNNRLLPSIIISFFISTPRLIICFIIAYWGVIKLIFTTFASIKNICIHLSKFCRIGLRAAPKPPPAGSDYGLRPSQGQSRFCSYPQSTSIKYSKCYAYIL